MLNPAAGGHGSSSTACPSRCESAGVMGEDLELWRSE